MLTITQTVPMTDSRCGGIEPAQESIETKAEARLRQASYVELRHVSCRLRDGVLTLRGHVPSYYLKQLAQTLVHSTEGVLNINNELDVGPIPNHLDGV